MKRDCSIRALHLTVAAVVFTTLLFFSCQSGQHVDADTARIPTSSFSALRLGACQAGETGEHEEYQMMHTIGVEWLRNEVLWSRVEPEPNRWDFSRYDTLMEMARRYNRKVLILLAYDAPWIYGSTQSSRNITPDLLPEYLDYVEKVARRYGKQAAGFEIWNEPNTPVFWKGSDEDFFELTRKTAALLQRIAPDTPVAVGSIFYHPVMGGKQFLNALIEEGVMKHADAVSLHPYALSMKQAAARVAEADAMLRKAGYCKELWITEIGFTTGGYYPNQVSPEGQARKVVEALTRLPAAGADLITWFKLLDGQRPTDRLCGISSEEFFGLAYPDFSLKPSGEAFRRVAPQLSGSQYHREGITVHGTPPRGLETFRFDRPDGSVQLLIWSSGKRKQGSLSGLEKIELLNVRTGIRHSLAAGDTFQIGFDPLSIRRRPSGEENRIILAFP